MRESARHALTRLGADPNADDDEPVVSLPPPVRRPPTRAPAPPPPAPSFLRQYGLLLAPLAVVAAVSMLVVVTAMRRPPPVRPSARPSPASASALDTIATAPDVASYVGKVVSWSGTVTELSPGRDRMMVKSGAHYFSGKSETPLPEPVKPGAAVKVTGVIVDRRQGVVMVLARQVE